MLLKGKGLDWKAGKGRKNGMVVGQLSMARGGEHTVVKEDAGCDCVRGRGRVPDKCGWGEGIGRISVGWVWMGVCAGMVM